MIRMLRGLAIQSPSVALSVVGPDETRMDAQANNHLDIESGHQRVASRMMLVPMPFGLFGCGPVFRSFFRSHRGLAMFVDRSERCMHGERHGHPACPHLLRMLRPTI